MIPSQLKIVKKIASKMRTHADTVRIGCGHNADVRKKCGHMRTHANTCGSKLWTCIFNTTTQPGTQPPRPQKQQQRHQRQQTNRSGSSSSSSSASTNSSSAAAAAASEPLRRGASQPTARPSSASAAPLSLPPPHRRLPTEDGKARVKTHLNWLFRFIHHHTTSSFTASNWVAGPALKRVFHLMGDSGEFLFLSSGR